MKISWRLPQKSPIKNTLFWLLVLMPLALASGILALIVTAWWLIALMKDPERFAKAGGTVQQLARDVYERQRSIWQAQNECIIFDSILFYKPKPGSCKFGNLEYSTVMTFDSSGFRKTSPASKINRQNLHRIIVLGDSQAMGWGVRDEETFASLLASEHGYEVFNLAVASYGTARELLRLRYEFKIEKGDIVVIQYHPNDLIENLAFLEGDGLPVRQPKDLARLAHTPQDYGILHVSASIGFTLKGKLLATLHGYDDKPVSSEKHVDTFLSVVDQFPELNDVRLVVCEVDNFGNTSQFSHILKRQAGHRMDVLEPMWNKSDFYRLDNHLNAQGHRKLASLIAHTLSGSI